MLETADIYRGRHPSTIPSYTLREAAHWLGLPQGTVRNWCLGRPTRPERKTRAHGFPPVIQLADAERKLLSFQNLVELHVLSVIRDHHDVPLQRVRSAVTYVQRKLGVPHPLAHSRMLTDGRDLLVERLDRLVNATRGGQLEMRPLVEIYLARLEHEGAQGLPVRLYPFTRSAVDTGQRQVAIDPRVQFGRPCIARRGVPTDAIADRWRAGEGILDLAKDFDCEPSEIEEAIRYEVDERKAA